MYTFQFELFKSGIGVHDNFKGEIINAPPDPSQIPEKVLVHQRLTPSV